MIDAAVVERYMRDANPIPRVDDLDADELAYAVAITLARREAVRQNVTQTPTRLTPPATTPQRGRAWAFSFAMVVVLASVGIATLVLRSDVTTVADEPAPPTTVSEGLTTSLDEALVTVVAEPVGPTAIAVAEVGDIWVGASDGVWHLYSGEAQLQERTRVADLTFAPDGTIWAMAGGLASLRNETWLDYPRPDGDLDNLTVGPDGTLWWGGSSGVYRLEGQQWFKAHGAIPDAFNPLVTNTLEVRVEAAPDGSVWVGTWWGWGLEAGGLRRLIGGVWDEIPLPGGRYDLPVINLAVAPNGDLWVVFVEPGPGTEDDWSLARFDGDTWRVFGEADGMPQNHVFSMAAGPDGVVWLAQEELDSSGLRPGGVVAFDGKQWKHFLDNESVRDVAVESDGTVWLAADRLYKIEP